MKEVVGGEDGEDPDEQGGHGEHDGLRRKHYTALWHFKEDGTDHALFFFQAEDDIRDRHVTGVQTCALPISNGHDGSELGDSDTALLRLLTEGRTNRAIGEERRVGKECRSRWSPYH